MKGKEVRITWIDAKMWGSGWTNEELDFFTLPVCCSRGLVVSETDDMILLSQSMVDGERANLIGIPKGCIKKIKVLK